MTLLGNSSNRKSIHVTPEAIAAYEREHMSGSLKRQLESELASGNDIQSYAWFHGHVPRAETETMLPNEGSFLIRSSLTNPGECVLSVRWVVRNLFVLKI